MSIEEELKSVGEAFLLPGVLICTHVISDGHINATYKLIYEDGGEEKSYVLQRINTEVFKKPREVMQNIELVTTYIREHFPEEACLYYHKTKSGENYFLNDGKFYRVMDFIESVTVNGTEDLEMIKKVGKGFGHFEMQLGDFDGAQLFETIPNFHNTKQRLLNLAVSAKKDVKGRKKEVEAELAYISSVAEKAAEISVRFYEKHDFPIRVTHNDTKSNNILFDKVTKEPLAVIDLDTVMPGMLTYDFGDGIRFIANTAAEDEPDLEKISLSMEKYTAFTEGFLRELRGTVTKAEAECMALAAFSVTVETGIRFLTDYLDGDVYFTDIHYPQHNLVRARDQIALAKDMERKMDDMNAVVRRVLEEEA